MPATAPCQPCCSVPLSVNIPGIEGLGGLDGTNGQNAYTFTIADFTYATGTITVISTAFMVVGQVLVISGPAHVRVSAITGPTTATVVALNYAGDIAPATNIVSGAGVSPGGIAGPAAIAVTTGVAILVAGTVTVATPLVTASSKIFLSRNTPLGALGNLSAPSASRVVGVGFTINSSSATDVSTVDWAIIG